MPPVSYNGAMCTFHRISGRARALIRGSRKMAGAAIFCLLPAVAVSGCGQAVSSLQSLLPGSGADTSSMGGTRDNTPEVLVPSAPGDDAEGTQDLTLDFSNRQDGYFAAAYTGDSSKVKLQVTAQDGITCTYNLPTDGSVQFFPFSDGSGVYDIGVYTNVEGTVYAAEYQTSADTELADEYLPFLYPNQYVWFTEDSEAVAAAEDIAAPADTDLDVVSLIYNYVVSSLTYDWDEAEHAESGYIPDVDAVLSGKKGICLDYSALMAAMLRSQRIPTRMEIGYAGTTYHAWISTYIDEIGWVNGIIQFDGTDWSMMDPTLASTEGSQKVKKYISDPSYYRTCYRY